MTTDKDVLAYTKEEAEIGGSSVRLTRNRHGRLIGVDIHHSLTDGYIGLHEPDYYPDWFNKKYSLELSDDIPKWLLEIIKEHADGTDRSADDGCFCGDPERFDQHLGDLIWKQIQLRFTENKK